MDGKEKCELLRQIREEIAEVNDIEFESEECTFEGDCSGTCPKCEEELIYLEEELVKTDSKIKNIFNLDLSKLGEKFKKNSLYVKIKNRSNRSDYDQLDGMPGLEEGMFLDKPLAFDKNDSDDVIYGMDDEDEIHRHMKRKNE